MLIRVVFAPMSKDVLQAMVEAISESSLPSAWAGLDLEAFSHAKAVRDYQTEEYLRRLGLNSRQIQAILWLKTHERLTNTQYQRLFGVSKRTASLDLSQLIQKGLVEQVGTTGKGTYYRLHPLKGAIGEEKGQQRGNWDIEAAPNAADNDANGGDLP